MSVTFSEKFRSRRTLVGSNPSTELVYNALVEGEADEDLAIKAAALATLPDTYDGKPRQSIEIEQDTNDLWRVTITYAYSRGSFAIPVGGSGFSFDTIGGQRKITQSLQTIASYAPPTRSAPDYKGAIGVSDAGVEGAEIPDRKFEFEEIRVVDATSVNAAFLGNLYATSGTVNEADYTLRGVLFAAGELLFLGATGNQRAEDEYEIVYKFAASPGATIPNVGDIVDIVKQGWDYLWVHYREEVDQTANRTVLRPDAAYVERVIERSDFTLLGL